MDNITANLNAAAEKYDIYSSYDFMPSIAAVVKVTPFLKLNAGYSTSVRYPDFTELYYNDPYNHGNPDLKAERCVEYSGGADIETGAFKFGLSDRKSTRLNSSHANISYAVFCL